MQNAAGDHREVASPESTPARTGFVVSDLLALVLLLLAVIGALLDRALLALVGALVLAVVLVARIWARVALEGVRYRLSVTPARVFEGDELRLTLCIENHKSIPVSRVKIRERLPPGLALIGSEDSGIHSFGTTVFDAVTGLAPRERVRLRYSLKAQHRGHKTFGPARLEAGDPFGFYTSAYEVARPRADLIVYPRLTAAPPLLPLIARPMGDVIASMRTFDDPNLPAAVREYRVGDPMRAIDWKVTARRGDPYVRINDASVSGTIALMLECDTRDEASWESSPETLEHGVRTAASLAAELIGKRYSVGLLANGVPPGDLGRIAVPPAAGPRQLGMILEALARVQSIIVKPLPVVAAENAGRLLPFGASVICVTGIDDPHTSKMLAGFASRGHPALLVKIIDPKTPSGPAVQVTRYGGFGRSRWVPAGGI